MSGYQDILNKLEGFTKKYYTKQLIKGVLLFLTLGLLFWLAIMSLEYWLWLGNNGRLALFVVFVIVEVYLLYTFIAVPASYLFKIRSGIDNREASKLIGKHFPEVDDKLLNLLQLSENTQKSDLLLASIEQRAQSLGPVPFAEAIDFKDSYKYAKYVFIPLGLLAFIWISGNIVSFFNSYERVVNYDLAYERPAPFSFKVLNDKLEVLDNEPLTIRVATEGTIQPESVSMVINGEELLLKRQGDVYTYTFEAPVAESTFYLTANGWNSKSYFIRSYSTPALVDFQMKLNFPKYLNRASEIVTGTGNAVVPEGTQISWNIEGTSVDRINMNMADTSFVFDRSGNQFAHTKRVFKDLDYELSTSNTHVSDFERLAYGIDVIRDAKAVVQVAQVLDSLNPNQSFFTGHAADDYGISQIRVVCYPADDNQSIQRIDLERPNTNVYQFYYTFPSGFQLEEGKNYKLFFEVVDNDGIRGGKVSKSKTFDTNLYDDNQLKDKELEFQNTTLSKMNQSLEQYKDQKEELSKLTNLQKEERALTFEDKNQIKDFLQKQERQEQLMQKFSNDLKESLNKDKGDNEFKMLLQERLERQELEAKKNERLLKELNEISDKIKKEELQQKLEELGKNQGKNTRNLEQLLELTKRYYVTEKASQLSKELGKLSERQDILSKLDIGEKFSNKEQEKLNENFERLSKELEELLEDNKDLQKPMSMDVSEKQSEDVKSDQKEALEEINKHQGNDQSSDSQERMQSVNKITQKQRSAAQKMKEMSEALQQGAMGGGGSQDTEDAEMLRQILDNLVTFSFKQENLFDKIESADVDIAQFSKTVKDQNELRRLFEHVDDSLFALSLRRVELSEFVNEQITEVYYNIDKSLESIAENQIYQGASYQQYVINATNALADFLANILDNMQQNMKAGQGQGEGSDFQLPDIIKGQQSIQEKMQGSGQKGKPSQNQGEQEGEGQGNQEGDGQGQEGQQKGQQGQGENGEQEGSNGNGNGQGEMGLNEVYEIYKQQQFLRQQLEQQLQDMINKQDGDLAKKLLRQMEDFENDLLENGITERTRSKANTIQHELMKLENATLEQGKNKERESTSNDRVFANPITTRPELLKDYQNDIEILNRQALPLRQNYEQKVKVYFKND
ncbi:hypothetical protein AB1A65_04140 [Muricauda sp. ANG21]|uniref:hypothetical protein n=1 Tax=Allomuricauda sp. ANG21 TaxID=3042468 RepID=UPI0034563888